MISRIVRYFQRRAWDTPDSRALKLYAARRYMIRPADWEWPSDFYERICFYEDLVQAQHEIEVRKIAERQ